jgi:hypothetical protein
MTSAVDERGGVAEIPGSADDVALSSLSIFGSNIAALSLHATRRWLGASFAVVLWVISAYLLIVIRERETAADAREGSRDDADGPAMRPGKI